MKAILYCINVHIGIKPPASLPLVPRQHVQLLFAGEPSSRGRSLCSCQNLALQPRAIKILCSGRQDGLVKSSSIRCASTKLVRPIVIPSDCAVILRGGERKHGVMRREMLPPFHENSIHMHNILVASDPEHRTPSTSQSDVSRPTALHAPQPTCR